MRLKLKYILIILPILIGASLIFKVNLSQASCSSQEISQLMKEYEKCGADVNCLINLLNRLEACETETQEKEQEAAAKAAKFQNRVDNLASSISEKNASIYSLNSEIANLEYEINKLFSEIKTIEKRMAKNKAVVKTAVKNFYEYDKENIITIILAQKSISGFFDEVFYVGSIQERISNIVAQLKKDKKTLNKKKKELANRKEVLEINRNSLVSQRNTLAKQQAKQNELLSSAQANEAGYESTLEKIKEGKSVIDDKMRSLARQSIDLIIGGGGGYPYAGQCGYDDPWKFPACQCTSYAAWKWFSWGDKFGEKSMKDYLGQRNAKNWPWIASNLGYKTGHIAQRGAIASWNFGEYGHVAIVENVYSNGSIRISEYNYAATETYSIRTIPKSWYNTPSDPYKYATFIYPRYD
ncbi:MAG: CHAP domain-containing protein [Candidatus Pacebacteria bacterium]|nr:CHAP domain-containing protein [Candidatus Paceibacterota bacterium]